MGFDVSDVNAFALRLDETFFRRVYTDIRPGLDLLGRRGARPAVLPRRGTGAQGVRVSGRPVGTAPRLRWGGVSACAPTDSCLPPQDPDLGKGGSWDQDPTAWAQHPFTRRLAEDLLHAQATSPPSMLAPTTILGALHRMHHGEGTWPDLHHILETDASPGRWHVPMLPPVFRTHISRMPGGLGAALVDSKQ